MLCAARKIVKSNVWCAPECMYIDMYVQPTLLRLLEIKSENKSNTPVGVYETRDPHVVGLNPDETSTRRD